MLAKSPEENSHEGPERALGGVNGLAWTEVGREQVYVVPGG